MTEIIVRLIREPNSVPIYQVMYGRECILRLVSIPSDDDIKRALANFRAHATTQESARLTQLRGKHRQGAWTGDDDPPSSKDIA